MKCIVCKNGETKAGKTTFTHDHDDITIVIRDVPATVCENCGEGYIDADIADTLIQKMEGLKKSGMRMGVQEYAA